MIVYPINRVAFYQDGNHAPAAVLYAAENTTPDQLSSIRNAFEETGWRHAPVYDDGQNTLQISGFKNASELEQWLRAQNFIGDETAITQPAHNNQDQSLHKRIGKSSLKLTGLLNILGDGILALSGHHKKDPFRITGAGLLSLGSINLLRYGNADSSQYVQEISDDLKIFISRQEGSSPPAIGTITKAENFLYRNPAQVTLGINSLGATSNLISGIRTTRNGEGWGALGFGISSVGLKLISLLIPEKSKSETGNAANPLVGWIQEKPLRFYGYTSLMTDMFLGVDAFQEYKKDPKNWGLYTSTALAGACYSLADLTVAMSSKDHTNQEEGKFTPYEQKEIEAIAATSILGYSHTEQQHKADALGEFLAERKEMHGDAQSISKTIIEQANQLRSSSWIERSSKPTAAGLISSDRF